MEGRYVVIALMFGVAGLGSLSWAWGLSVRDAVDAKAAENNLRRLTREEAAYEAAKGDRFGLPSRLENAPGRDIEAFRKRGTEADPLPTTADGLAGLFELYTVSVEGCAKTHLRGSGVEMGTEVTVGAEIKTIAEKGRVARILPPESSAAWEAFSLCLGGAVRPAVFQPGPDTKVHTQVLLPD